MAGRLTASRPLRRGPLLAAIVALVLLAHLLLGSLVRDLREGWDEVAAMPERLSVAFVRELKQSAAPRPAARPLPPPPAPAPKPALPASAPASAPLAPPKPKPEPVPAAAEPIPVAAASAPRADLPAAPDLAAAVPLAASAANIATSMSEALPASAPASAAAPEQPGPEWPPSTRLSYTLQGNYRGEVHGNAQVQWIRQGRHYQVHLDVTVGPSFAPLIARRMSSDGEITPHGIAPLRYDEDTRVLFSKRGRVSLRFDGAQLRFPDGRVLPSPAGVQDSASQFVHLTWLFLTGREALRPGRVIELPLALPRRLYRWRYEVLGEEQLATKMGPLQAWHLQPQFNSQAGSELQAEVWLAPTLQYLPVRLRIVQDEQTFIDLMLDGPPLQAEPGT